MTRPTTFTPTEAFHEMPEQDRAEWMMLIEQARAKIAELPRTLKLADTAKPVELRYNLDVGAMEDRIVRPHAAGWDSEASKRYAAEALRLYTTLQQQEGKGFAMHDTDRNIASMAWSKQLRDKVRASDAERKRREEQRVVIDTSMGD